MSIAGFIAHTTRNTINGNAISFCSNSYRSAISNGALCDNTARGDIRESTEQHLHKPTTTISLIMNLKPAVNQQLTNILVMRCECTCISGSFHHSSMFSACRRAARFRRLENPRGKSSRRVKVQQIQQKWISSQSGRNDQRVARCQARAFVAATTFITQKASGG